MFYMKVNGTVDTRIDFGINFDVLVNKLTPFFRHMNLVCKKYT